MVQSSGSRSGARLIWAGAIGVSLLLSILAALRGGYIGPDYQTHLERLTQWSRVFDFSNPDPPVYYLLGYGVFRAVGSSNAFPVTLSILQAALNGVALWHFFRYVEPRFRSSLVSLALAIFLALLPVRVIHATTIGTDCLTIPCFVLLLFLFDRFVNGDGATSWNAAVLGLGLALATWVKYSFIALIPALFALFVVFWMKRRWRVSRFVGICVLSLLLPSALTLYSFHKTRSAQGYYRQLLWLPEGFDSGMNFKDLLSVKKNDVELFGAPEYFKKQILAPHQHSYLGLVHLGVFTDTMNLFQELSVPQRFGSIMIPDQKVRREWKTGWMQASMLLGLLWTVLALIGSASNLLHALRNFWKDKLQREDAAIFLGFAYFLLMFLPIPFVYNANLFGFWTPRLILPSLLCFFLAAFLLIDRSAAPKSPFIAQAVFSLVVIQCAIEVVMLA
ncbi:MAG TPA: glycosyltransferase family 39 protein [Chthoniobacterales bacterium]